jgi:ABC-type nitrate/sulfonate/bicarbonate transport system substrate-binding protein
MTFSRRSLLLGSAGFIAALTQPEIAFAQAATTLQFGDVSRTAASWTLELARTNGFFDREKLALETTFVGNNPAVAQQVVGGVFDLGVTTVETAIRAVESGAPIAMIGSGMLKFPYAFMAAPSIGKPADLKGKKIVLDLPKSFLSYNWNKWSKANHLEPNDVEIVYDGSSANRFAALVAGAVVLAPVTQPLDFMALDRGYKKFIDMSVYANNFGFTAIVAKKSWLDANTATAKAFLHAGSAANDFFYDKKNREAAVTALVNFSKVEPAIANKVYDYYTADLRPYAKNMALPDANVKSVADYLLEAGELKSVGKPAKYVDHRFVG